MFQGRFRSILVEDGTYIRRLARYIHLNPLEAGLVSKAEHYRWSSHNAYFGLDALTWLQTDRVLYYFGECRTEALEKLAEYMSAKEEAATDAKEIERAKRSGVYGSEEFTIAFVESDGAMPLLEDDGHSIEELMTMVCGRLDVTIEQLRSEEKTRQVAAARAILARICQRHPNFSLGDMCKALDKHHGTVSRLAAKCTKSTDLEATADELTRSFALSS